MSRMHHYDVATTWTGNRGEGTSGYRAFDRSYDTTVDGRPLLQGSSDPRSAATPPGGTPSCCWSRR